jgi:lycopene cyclase domain-containing protein
MAIAQEGQGPGPTLRALASQVHPVFMLPPLAASWFGAIVVGIDTIAAGTVHMLAIFCAVYTAHIKDGYVDFYVRDEDDSHPLTVRGCFLSLAGATIGFALCIVYLWLAVGATAAIVTLPTWFLGYLHAPQFDVNPVTATVGYPTGIALAILGGSYVQTTAIAPEVVAFCLVFLIVLSGVKIIDDAQDYHYDRSIGKRTAVVALGPGRAIEAAYGLILLGLVAVLWFTVDGYFPPTAILAALALAVVVSLTLYADATLSTMLLVRGTYVFFALLVIAAWYQPLAGVALPDIGVFGPDTYLLTEVLFGSVAFLLLYRAGALGRAVRTIAALYPIAYLWDWYTLEVGVFAIELRTGIDLFGIPLEEHLFMLVVPAVVIAVYETLESVFPLDVAGEIKTGVPEGSTTFQESGNDD